MATKDLHEKPFDEGTIAKLEIFEDYARAWIPTFVMSGVREICIFDFFAGTGYDKNGVAGSPIRILERIREQIGNLFQEKVKISLFFNEFDQDKSRLLKEACGQFLERHSDVGRAVEIVYFSEDFKVLFPKLLNKIRDYPSLVYLDQNGIKFLEVQYLLEFEKMKQTDFLYFVSSSYFLRFGNSQEFRLHFEIDMETVKRDPYRFIHRNVLESARKKLSPDSPLRLYPFSIKKGSNIHGLIFGASHPRAVDKFLAIAWKRNGTNGEANFDIDEDAKKGQLDLFTGMKQPSKIESFQERVRHEVQSARITNNVDLFNYTLEEGHIGRHASDCLKEMKRQGIVGYEGSSPLVTYDKVYKNPKRLEYILLKT